MPTAMIIDDDPIAHAVMEDALKSFGFTQFYHADDGGEAVSLLRRVHKDVDLVITDILMPHLDGIEFVSFMANFDRNCPVIIASGAHSSLLRSTLSLAKTLGVNVLGDMRKPLQMERLELLLAKLEAEHFA